MKERHMMAVAAHVLLTDAQQRVLFLRRAGTGYADGFFSVPAGHVELGETVTTTAARELTEETGIVVPAGELVFRLIQHKHDTDGQERIDLFFEAKLPDGQEPWIAEPEACDKLVWASLGDPPAPVVPYVQAAAEWMLKNSEAGLNHFGFD